MRLSPVFTLTAMLTLALGFGANIAVFTVVNGVLFRPLPFPEPERLMMIRQESLLILKPGQNSAMANYGR